MRATDVAIVFLTFGLLAVGIVQAYIYWSQAKLMQLALGSVAESNAVADCAVKVALEAGELAKSQFVAAHRPRIAIKGLFILTTKAKDSSLLFQIYNRGDSEAQIVDVKFHMSVIGQNSSIWPKLALVEPTLPMSVQCGYDERARAVMGGEWKKWLRDEYKPPSETSDRWEIEIRVTVAYLDTAGMRRQTSAHRRYDLEAHSFTRVKDSEFEYED